MIKKHILIIISLIALALTTYSAHASSKSAKRVQKDVSVLLKTKNVDTMMRMTWPGFWDIFGSRKKARKEMRKGFRENQQMGLKHTKIKFLKAPTFLKTKKMHYVVVPYNSTVHIKSQGRIIKLRDFYLGARKSPKHRWKYIDGASLDAFGVKKFFPDFPDNFRLPKGGIN